MARIPAWCPRCDISFDSGFAMSSGATMHTFGCSSNCPQCGGRAPVLDGSFTAEDEILHVISAADWSREMLTRFHAAATWAAEHIENEADAAVRRIDDVSPRIATVVRRVLQEHGRKVAAGVLLAASAAVLQSVTDRVLEEVWPNDPPAQTTVVVPPPSVTVVNVEGEKPPWPTLPDTPDENPLRPSQESLPQSPGGKPSEPSPPPPGTESPR